MHGFARSVRPLTTCLVGGAVVVALVTTVACGGSGGTSVVATASSGSDSGSSGSGSGDASSGNGGSATSASGADAGAGASSGTSGGGSTVGGTATGTASGSSSGGAAGASAPADPCAGLVPASVGAPVETALATGSVCGPSSSDPAGRITLGTWGSGAQMWPYSASGSVQGDPMTALVVTGEDLDRWFHWTSGGYRGIVQGPSGFFPFQLATWDSAGRLLARSATGVVAITPDGRGGSVAIVSDQNASPASTFQPKLLEWIDAAGNLTRSVSLDQDAGAALVDWTTGHVFALVFGQSSRPTQGRWYDGDGNPLTAWFSLNVLKGSGSAWHLLVDGTVVLTGPSHEWAVATRDGVEGPVAVPDWLKARPSTRLSTIRGGRGYAVVTLGIADRLEVVTASGASCGYVTLPSLAPQVGIYAPRLDIGQDGTVLHSVGPSPASGGVPSSCTFQWWPGLLK